MRSMMRYNGSYQLLFLDANSTLVAQACKSEQAESPALTRPLQDRRDEWILACRQSAGRLGSWESSLQLDQDHADMGAKWARLQDRCGIDWHGHESSEVRL
jgi:hypothetical protein